jgi:Ca2+-binding RTX toxin-like protein
MALSTGNPYLDALGGDVWPTTPPGNYGANGQLILTVFFDQDTSAGHSTGGAWTTAEQAAFWNALHAWTSVANIDILEVDNPAAADVFLRKETSAELGATILGRTDFPLSPDPHVSAYNVNLYWTAAAMQPGGYTMETFIHEFGHGLGLAHPHDNGMGTGLFPGVDGLDASGNPFDFDGDGSLFLADGTTRDPGDISADRGANSLNAIPYTIMTYNEAIGSNPATAADRGFASTPLAFDIAALQAMYGARNNNDGDTVYTLVDDGPGTSYSCIWDTSGTDTIQYNGSNGTTIDLRAATLLNEVGGGGFLSQVNGVKGGFTIAADRADFDQNGNFGVQIENAIGGSGDDKITGNQVDNTLTGNAGKDTLNGLGGHDTLVGGADSDTYFLNDVTAAGYDAVVEDVGGGDADEIDISAQTGFASYTLGASIENGVVTGADTFDLTGNSLNNKLTGNDAVNVLVGAAGKDTLLGMGGADDLTGGLDDDYLDGGDDSDTVRFAGTKADFVIIGTATDLTFTDRTLGGWGTDRVLNAETFVFSDGSVFTAEDLANAAPIITSNGGNDLTVPVPENTFFATHVVATDADGDLLTFTLSGADAALFQIATNGDITFRTAPDFEAPVGGDNVYNLTVTVTDTSFATDTQAITVNVTDVFEIIDTSPAAVLNGTAGADTIIPGDGQDTVLAGDGDDVIKATINDGKDVYNGGNGSDTVDYSALTVGVTVQLGQNGGPGSGFGIQAGEDKLISIENVIGSAGSDQIIGNSDANVLDGRAGDDVLTGGGGNDSIVFRPGFGQDQITDFDDDGDDMIVFSTAVFADWGAVQKAMTASGNDVVITFDAANTITLIGTSLTDMSQSDFLFVP